MSTSTDRLISCVDLCKNYKFDNAIKKCVDYCTHQHLVRMIIKPKTQLSPLSPSSSSSPSFGSSSSSN